MRVIRLASAPGRRVAVGAHPHLVPLIDTIEHHAPYYLLTLGLGQVRLFGGTWGSLAELDLGPIMERQHQIEPELQHQHQPPLRGTATFHGHGGRDASDVIQDKFVHEVASSLRRRLGAASTTPLYLAAVEEYLPRLQATGQLPTLRPRLLTGSLEGVRAHELLERMRPVITADLEERYESLRSNLERAARRGALTTDLHAVIETGVAGRVDTLVLDPAMIAEPNAGLDRMIADTMRHGGQVHTLSALPDGTSAVAVLRY